MKKLFLILLSGLLFSSHAYAVESELLNMRHTFSADARQIKDLLLESKDVVLMSSMWDSCILTMTQLDAYFYMIGIFNSIKKEDWQEDTIDYLVKWLTIIKKTNKLNIRSLDGLIQTVEPRTQVYKMRLKKHFSKLNKIIDTELGKLALLKKSLTLASANP